MFSTFLQSKSLLNCLYSPFSLPDLWFFSEPNPGRPTSLSVHWSWLLGSLRTFVLWNSVVTHCLCSAHLSSVGHNLPCWNTRFWVSIYGIVPFDFSPHWPASLSFADFSSKCSGVSGLEDILLSLITLIWSQGLSTIYVLIIQTFLSFFLSLPLSSSLKYQLS